MNTKRIIAIILVALFLVFGLSVSSTSFAQYYYHNDNNRNHGGSGNNNQQQQQHQQYIPPQHHGTYTPSQQQQHHYYVGNQHVVFNHREYGHAGQRFYYRGNIPSEALFGIFLGEIILNGMTNQYWWPYYTLPVDAGYYNSYYAFPYPTPLYVIKVLPNNDNVFPPGFSQATTGQLCYVPKTDNNGNIIRDDGGNMIPDPLRPIPCPQ